MPACAARDTHACSKGGPTWLLTPALPVASPPIHSPRSGQVQLDITWEATPRSVLTTKLRALERVLAQRQEILAALRPVPASVVRTWAPPEQGTLQVRAWGCAVGGNYNYCSPRRGSCHGMEDWA